jgi:hypothetical protein
MSSFKMVCALLATACALTMVGCPSTSNVINVDKIPNFNLKSIENDVVNFFNGTDITPVQVGDFIVSATGGFLKQVVGVDEANNIMKVLTQQAPLDQVIENGSLAGKITWSNADFEASGNSLSASGDMTINLAGLTVFSQDGISLKLLEPSTIRFAPDIDLSATFADHKLASFSNIATGPMDTNLTIQIAANEGYTWSKEVPLIQPIVQPWCFYIGEVPVVGTVQLSIDLGCVATIGAGLSVTSGFSTSDNVVLGASFENGKWTSQSSNDFQITPKPIVITLSSSANLNVYLKPLVTLDVYGMSNVSAWAEPFLNANCQIIPSPLCFNLTGGVNFGINYDLSIFSLDVVNKTWNFNPIPTQTLYTYTLPYTIPTTWTIDLPLN